MRPSPLFTQSLTFVTLFFNGSLTKYKSKQCIYTCIYTYWLTDRPTLTDWQTNLLTLVGLIRNDQKNKCDFFNYTLLDQKMQKNLPYKQTQLGAVVMALWYLIRILKYIRHIGKESRSSLLPDQLETHTFKIIIIINTPNF